MADRSTVKRNLDVGVGAKDIATLQFDKTSSDTTDVEAQVIVLAGPERVTGQDPYFFRAFDQIGRKSSNLVMAETTINSVASATLILSSRSTRVGFSLRVDNGFFKWGPTASTAFEGPWYVGSLMENFQWNGNVYVIPDTTGRVITSAEYYD